MTEEPSIPDREPASSASPSGARPSRSAWWRVRTEMLLLAVAFLCTAWAKTLVVLNHPIARPGFAIPAVLLADLAFLAVLAALIHLLYAWRGNRLTARLALVIAVFIAAWSVTNAVWLVRTEVQIQPGIVMILLRDIKDLWPLLKSYAQLSPGQLIMVCALAIGLIAVLVWRWLWPQPPEPPRRAHGRRACGWLAVAVIALCARPALLGRARLGFAGEVLAFSSHWHALAAMLVGGNHDASEAESSRTLARAGARHVVPPPPEADRPNIVLILLESVPHRATSLNGGDPRRTPYLAYLARQGVEFCNTHVPVSHTTKAFWATLTGSIPVIASDYVEAVPADEPYESLATILKRLGYRSGFFMMSKGTYECAPGLFSNLGFDWAWFRENLQDPSRDLGYMGGDDFCLIRPLVRWARRQNGPFLAAMITTMTHDPYEVPGWLTLPGADDQHDYVQALTCTDAFVRSLLAALEDEGLMDNTLVCILGDHGTGLDVSRGQARWHPSEDVLRVPWVLYWPGHLEAGRVVDWPASQLDVTPTLLSAIGCDVTGAGFEGRNALSPGQANRRLYFSSWYTDSPLGFLEGTEKFVFWPYLDRLIEYDLARDPNEAHPQPQIGVRKDWACKQILSWQRSTQVRLPARRYRHKRAYEHWRVFGAGRSAWAVFEPSGAPSD